MPAEKESRIVNYGTAGGAAAPIHSLTRGWIRITRSTIEPRKKDSHRSRPRPRRPAIQTGGDRIWRRRGEEGGGGEDGCTNLWATFSLLLFFCFRCRFCSVRFGRGKKMGMGNCRGWRALIRAAAFPIRPPLAGASGTRGDPFPPFNYSCFVL
jgi:hypothetical protein